MDYIKKQIDNIMSMIPILSKGFTMLKWFTGIIGFLKPKKKQTGQRKDYEQTTKILGGLLYHKTETKFK